MVSINKNLVKLTEDDVVRISNEYLMGNHKLSKDYGFTLKGLNNKRDEYGFDSITKDMSFDYRLDYIRDNYSIDEIQKELFEYMLFNKMDDARWVGINLFDCSFGRDFAKFFKTLLGKDIYSELSEKARVKKLTNTHIDLYGGVGLAGKATKAKADNSNLDKYGVINPMHVDEFRSKLSETNHAKYGGASPFSSADIQKKSLMRKMEKISQSMIEYKDNGYMDDSIFDQSPVEKLIFYNLVERFGADDVYYQYGVYPDDSRYPYPCDFYIKSLDLFIEINAHYTHGDSWFDELDAEHIEMYEHLLGMNTKYAKQYIRTWVEQDVEKRRKAKKEALNYLVFWDNEYYQKDNKRHPKLTDFYLWFDQYNCDVDLFLKEHPANTY